MANEGIRGDVTLEPTAVGWHGRTLMIARVLQLGTNRDLLPAIEGARVLRVRLALVISGLEANPRGRKSVERCPQTWVCAAEPLPPDCWPSRARARAVTGFDPADDDA